MTDYHDFELDDEEMEEFNALFEDIDDNENSLDLNLDDFIDLENLIDFVKVDDDGNEVPTVKQYSVQATPSGRKNQKSLPKYPYASRDTILMSENHIVYIVDGAEKYEVGICKAPITPLNIMCNNIYQRANRYTEEVGGIGANMGFSTFVHLAAVLLIGAAGFDTNIEPITPGDLIVDGVSYEVTGLNYKKRRTECQVTINKYAFLSCVAAEEDYHDFYLRSSFNEDVGHFDTFIDTGFDVTSTTRSDSVRSLASMIGQITARQKRAINNNFKAFLSVHSYDKSRIPERTDVNVVLQELEEAIIAGSKQKDKYYVPCPFKVLPVRPSCVLSEEEVERRRSIDVMHYDYHNSTYHTVEALTDYSSIFSEMLDWTVEQSPNYPSMSAALYARLLEYKIFASAHICATLYPKICGKAGKFYDKFINVGLNWVRDRRNNLSWLCNFFMFEHPGKEEEVGRWTQVDKGYWLGPTFKVSRQDIHYTSVVTVKFQSMVSACLPLLSDSATDVIPKMMVCLAAMLHSTWRTSFYTGSTRFVTCCHMSKSGDVCGLIQKQLKQDTHEGSSLNLRTCDYVVLMRYKSFLERRLMSSVTPMFELPKELMAIEKDFSQLMQWHMRTTNHDTACMVKACDSARRHALEDEEHNKWVEFECSMLKKMLDVGLTKTESLSLFTKSPKFPHLNVFVAIALSYQLRERNQPKVNFDGGMGFTIWKLLTDRNCVELDKEKEVLTVKRAKVVDAMHRLLKENEPIHGAYELIAKMSESRQPKMILLNHAKDAKETDREISQMIIENRIPQNFAESMAECWTGPNAVDQMSDKNKYSNHVNDTMECCKTRRSINISEDRKSFCQEMEPQQQALVSAVLGVDSGSTALKASAAMGLMNVQRTIVLPPRADAERLLTDIESQPAEVLRGVSSEKTRAFTIQKNMTQGLGAVQGAVVNTLYVDGMNAIIYEMCPFVEKSIVRTTSDDVKKNGVIAKKYNFRLAAMIYSNLFNFCLHMMMMVENLRKLMEADLFSEFNNVIATLVGMISQSPVFATLAVQPLLSKSIFGDLVDVVNSARSTLAWGCPPDVLETVKEGLLMVFRQKWLMTMEELDSLKSARLLPLNMDELISGFWPRDDRTLSILVDNLREDTRKDVLAGTIPLFKAIKRIQIRLDEQGKKKKRKRKEFDEIKGLKRANRVGNSIYAARMSSEILNSRYVQPISHGRRIGVKRKFFEVMNSEPSDVDIQPYKKLAPLPVRTATTVARRRHMLPNRLGEGTGLSTVNIRNVQCARQFGMTRASGLTDEEKTLVALDEKAFEKAVAVCERQKHYQGVMFKCPGGLPLTRTYDGKKFIKPQVFNYAVELEPGKPFRKEFVYNGRAVADMRVCYFSSGTIEMIKRRYGDYKLCFGHGWLNGEHLAFFCDTGYSDIKSVPVENTSSVGHCYYHNTAVCYITLFDLSPLKAVHHKSDLRPEMSNTSGDGDAIMNYGMFCRSNNPSGFAIFCNFFRENNSFMPRSMIHHIVQYPYFHTGHKCINAGRHVRYIDSRCISKVRLVYDSLHEGTVTIALTGSEPVVTFDDEEELMLG